MKTTFLAGLLSLTAVAAAAEYVNPFAYPQPEDTTEFFALIEIPQDSIVKYEIDAATGHVIVDRFQSMPVNYPANYGSIPSSMGGDGDPLDVLVYSREPIVPGAMILVRAIGVLNMIDNGEIDDKIVAVPVSAVDPTYDTWQDMSDMPEIEVRRLQAFFEVYKNLPGDRVDVELPGFQDAATAQTMVSDAIAAARTE